MRKLKLQTTRAEAHPLHPQYQLQYLVMGSREKTLSRSHALRRWFFGGYTLYLEMDSLLFTGDQAQRDQAANALLQYLSGSAVTFRHSQRTVDGTRNFLSITTSKPTERHWIGAVLHPSQWQNPEFEAALPTLGLRCYGFSAIESIDEFLGKAESGQADPAETLHQAELMAFDVAIYGQMGISSPKRSIAEIQARLDQFSD